MSERNISTLQDQDKELRRYHSEKSAVSSDDSYGRREEVAMLRNRLKNLIIGRNWSQEQAELYEGKIQEYELSENEYLLVNAQKIIRRETEYLKAYNEGISEVENRIKWLTLKYPAALEQKKNYVSMKVTVPPGDYE